jgi:protoporphyrinogen oxidase
MSPKAVIFGAGITGLSAGGKLAAAGYSVLVVEREGVLGGMSATFLHQDYRLDYGPHKIFTVLEPIDREIQALFAPGELLAIPKKSRIRLGGKYLNNPVGIKDIFLGLGLLQGLRCGLGYAWSLLVSLAARRTPVSYRDWVVGRFGRPIHDLIFGPYAAKIWGPPESLSKELAESRIAAPNLLEMLRQMLLGRGKKSPVIHAEVFHYPRLGISELSGKLAARITSAGGEIRLNRRPAALDLTPGGFVGTVTFDDGRREDLGPDDVVVSTVPLAALLPLLHPALPDSAQQAAVRLKTRNLILLYVALNQDRVILDNWLFFPEARYRFNRIFEQKAFSAGMGPAGRTVLCVEITCDARDPLWQASDAEVFAAVRPQLQEAGLLTAELLESFTRRLTNGYPVYDLEYRDHLAEVMAGINRIGNLYSVGRQGGFSYTGMADSMDIGFKTAGFIAGRQDKAHTWLDYSRQFYHYLVVD